MHKTQRRRRKNCIFYDCFLTPSDGDCRLELATARTLLESSVDRSGCVVAPLPSGTVDGTGTPIHGTGAALVVGGAALRRGASETLDLAAATQGGLAWLPTGSSPSKGCSSAAVVVAPCFGLKPANKRLVRPIVLGVRHDVYCPLPSLCLTLTFSCFCLCVCVRFTV